MEIKMKVFTPNLCFLRFEELTGAQLRWAMVTTGVFVSKFSLFQELFRFVFFFIL
jgi:hypothetical protein